MADLRDRFALADRLTVPDLWDRVAAKTGHPGDQHESGVRRTKRSRFAAALIAVLVSVAAAALVWDAFSPSGEGTASSPSISVGNRPFGAVLLTGVPFAVCSPMSIAGSFGPGLDAAWLFGRPSTSELGCDVVEAEYVGVGTQRAVITFSEPLRDADLRQAQYLWPFAAADVNGDGVDELAIGAGSSGETPTQFALFRLIGSSMDRITWCSDCGARVAWGGPESGRAGAYEGAFCHEHDGSPVFSTWNVELTDDRASFTGWSIDYSLQGSRFEEAARRTILIPANATDLLPPGGGATLCGSPVHAASEFIRYAR
jgi:FG-GAP repeat